jgi:hypothetical protein
MTVATKHGAGPRLIEAAAVVASHDNQIHESVAAVLFAVSAPRMMLTSDLRML